MMNMKFRILTTDQKGFSLVEILVSVALISVIAFGSFSLMKMEVKTEKSQEKNTDTRIFISGLSRYFNSGMGCQELVGVTLDNAFGNFVINNYDGFGTKDGGVGVSEPITAGFNVLENYSQVASVQFRRKPGTPSIDKFVEGVAKKEQTIQISIQIREADRGAKLVAAGDGSLKRYFFEFPVITDTADVLESCSVGMTPEEICDSLRLAYDPNDGICRAVGGSSCVFRGSYIDVSCAPGGYACAPSFGGGTVVDNPFTGGQSCPANSSRVKTGNYSSSRNVSCGKKCTVTVTTTEEYYSCLDCPCFLNCP